MHTRILTNRTTQLGMHTQAYRMLAHTGAQCSSRHSGSNIHPLRLLYSLTHAALHNRMHADAGTSTSTHTGSVTYARAQTQVCLSDGSKALHMPENPGLTKTGTQATEKQFVRRCVIWIHERAQIQTQKYGSNARASFWSKVGKSSCFSSKQRL